MIIDALMVDRLSVEISNAWETCTVVDQVSFSLPQGKVLGIVGESGSGKTMTALSLLNLFPFGSKIKVNVEDIKLFGESIRGLSEKDMQKIRGQYMSMVFQETGVALHPSFSVGYQIGESLALHHDFPRNQIVGLTEALLGHVEFENPRLFSHKFPHELSGGQRQRVMLAVALAANPKILIADEPTTALDVITQKEILDLLMRLKNSYDLSMIFITHDLSVINYITDDVLVMYGGQVLEYGATKELLSQPRHPYTQHLLCAGNFDTMAMGSQPYASAPPQRNLGQTLGCVYAEKCVKCMPECRRVKPSIIHDTFNNRQVRCLFSL